MWNRKYCRNLARAYHRYSLAIFTRGWIETKLLRLICHYGKTQQDLINLEVISDPQLNPVIILLFSELGIPRACNIAPSKPEFKVCIPGIQEFRCDGETIIIQICYQRYGRSKIKNIEGLLLADPEIKVILHGAHFTVIACCYHGGLAQKGRIACGKKRIIPCVNKWKIVSHLIRRKPALVMKIFEDIGCILFGKVS